MDYKNGLGRLSLRWDNYNDNMKTGFHDLLTHEDFVDVTIAAEGKLIQAHKMVLSINSPYFRNLLKANPCQHPIVFLKDVTYKEISAILQFMYVGEVSIEREELGRLFETAKALQIKGFTLAEESNDGDTSMDHSMEENENCDKSEESNENNTEAIRADSGVSLLGKRMNMTQLGSYVTKVNSEMCVTELPSGNSQQWNDQVSNGIVKTEIPDPEYDDSECDSVDNGHDGNRVHLEQNDVSEQNDNSVTMSENLNSGHDLNNQLEMNDLYRPMEASQGVGQDLSNKPGSGIIYNLAEGCQGFATTPVLTKNQGRCPICGRILQHKKNLQTHIIDQHSGIFGCWPCKICHKVCRTWSALRVHTNRHHVKGLDGASPSTMNR